MFLCEFCEIFLENFFAEHFLANTFDMMLFFFFLQVNEVYSLKSIFLVKQWQIRRRNSQARLCCAVLEIKWNLHCQVVATHVLTEALEMEGKEELKN